jgi:hypothetical protein
MAGEQASGISSARERRAFGALLALTIAALVLRLVGIGALLPYHGFGDERVFTAQLELMRLRPEERMRDTRYGFYPHLVPRLAHVIESVLGKDGPRSDPRTLDEHLERASEDVLLIRRIVACLSVLAIPATYLLARLFAGRRAALFAAALTATSLVVLWYSTEARPHGAAVGLFTSTVVACVFARRRCSVVASLAAGVLLGLSIGVLQSGFLLLLPLAVAHVFPARGSRRAGLARLSLALVPPAFCLRAFYPFVFDATVDLPGHHVLGQAAIDRDTFDGRGFGVLVHSLFSHDPLIAVLVLAAIVAWIVRVARSRRAANTRDLTSPRDLELPRGNMDGWVVLSFALAYLAAFGAYSLTFTRYLLPIVPFLACFAAVELEQLLAGRRAAFATVAAALVVLQSCAALQLVRLRTREDTQAEAARWIRDHVDPDRERLLVQANVDLPLVRDRAALENLRSRFDNTSHPWIHWQLHVAPGTLPKPWFGLDLPQLSGPTDGGEPGAPAVELAARGATHIVVEARDAHRRPRIAPLFADASHREARFSPMRIDEGDDRSMLVADQDDEFAAEPCWAWRMLHARALGPVVEIYHIE